VTALYEGLLRRPPDKRELEHHTEAFRRSGLAYVVRDLVAGGDFQNRFRDVYRLAEGSPVRRDRVRVLDTLRRVTTNRLVNRALTSGLR